MNFSYIIVGLYSSARELLEYITFTISYFYFIFIASNPDEKVKVSFTTSIWSRDMLTRVLSGQVTTERSSSNASLPPRGKHV